ncbi:MAG: acyl-CoA dehydrogenase family protein [Nitrospinota bacterium]|nr:acyl-CoA dehydrogenase family protein [Nitrospinota bacterium]
MVDMKLTDEQLELKNLVKEFCDKELRPIAVECDRKSQTDPAGCFPIEVLKAASKLGLRTLGLSRELGGRDLDTLTHCIILEEVMAVEPGFAATFHQVWRLAQQIDREGTEEQREKYLLPFAEDDTCLISIGQTEPDSGTDNTFPYRGVEGGIKMSAVKEGNEWVLNGTKVFVACASLAKIFIVTARTDPSVPAPEGSTQFLMWRDTPGFRIGRTHDKLGAALLMNAELILENVRIPESDILIGVNEGFSDRARHFGRGAPMVATFGLGVARGAYEAALSYSQETVRNGSPLIQSDAIAMRLADMLTLIEATRSATWRAAWASDNREHYTQRDAAIASYFSTVCARSVCESAMQIFGKDGYTRNFPVEKFMRDAVMTNHTNNTVDVRLLKIGRSLSGQLVSTL